MVSVKCSVPAASINSDFQTMGHVPTALWIVNGAIPRSAFIILTNAVLHRMSFQYCHDDHLSYYCPRQAKGKSIAKAQVGTAVAPPPCIGEDG